jgi:hypothetical protein
VQRVCFLVTAAHVYACVRIVFLLQFVLFVNMRAAAAQIMTIMAGKHYGLFLAISYSILTVIMAMLAIWDLLPDNVIPVVETSPWVWVASSSAWIASRNMMENDLSSSTA